MKQAGTYTQKMVVEHSRHRRWFNFLVNLLAGLVTYTYQDKRPSLGIHPKGLPALPTAAF